MGRCQLVRRERKLRAQHSALLFRQERRVQDGVHRVDNVLAVVAGPRVAARSDELLHGEAVDEVLQTLAGRRGDLLPDGLVAGGEVTEHVPFTRVRVAHAADARRVLLRHVKARVLLRAGPFQHVVLDAVERQLTVLDRQADRQRQGALCKGLLFAQGSDHPASRPAVRRERQHHFQAPFGRADGHVDVQGAVAARVRVQRARQGHYPVRAIACADQQEIVSPVRVEPEELRFTAPPPAGPGSQLERAAFGSRDDRFHAWLVARRVGELPRVEPGVEPEGPGGVGVGEVERLGHEDNRLAGDHTQPDLPGRVVGEHVAALGLGKHGPTGAQAGPISLYLPARESPPAHPRARAKPDGADRTGVGPLDGPGHLDADQPVLQTDALRILVHLQVGAGRLLRPFGQTIGRGPERRDVRQERHLPMVETVLGFIRREEHLHGDRLAVRPVKAQCARVYVQRHGNVVRHQFRAPMPVQIVLEDELLLERFRSDVARRQQGRQDHKSRNGHSLHCPFLLPRGPGIAPDGGACGIVWSMRRRNKPAAQAALGSCGRPARWI